MNSYQFTRHLKKLGCTIEHGARHDIARYNGKMAAVPRHGGKKQLGTGLMAAIKKDLGLTK
jgi:mRNA interferase HicA